MKGRCSKLKIDKKSTDYCKDYIQFRNPPVLCCFACKFFTSERIY